MIEPHTPPPAWVRKRNGRLVPFDADKICRALFAASESCGRPDAFLARELADAAVHFLADEAEGSTPSTEQVQEVLAKVLREVRQYALAAAFEERARTRHGGTPGEEQAPGDIVLRFAAAAAPADVRDACLRSYALQAVFTRDLVAAHQDGLIVLEGLDTPERLHSVAIGPLRRAEDLLTRIEECAAQAGQTLVLDGVGHVLARSLAGQKRVTRQWIEETVRGFIDMRSCVGCG